MAAIKDLAKTADKWKRSTIGREKDYNDGVQNPRRPWAAATQAAEAAYVTGVTAAANAGRFGKGVARAGDAKWKAKTLAKGAVRWTQGILVSEGDYARGFGPYHETIANTTLPARLERGNPANIERVAIMAKALHDKKLQLQGAA